MNKILKTIGILCVRPALLLVITQLFYWTYFLSEDAQNVFSPGDNLIFGLLAALVVIYLFDKLYDDIHEGDK